MLEEEFKYFRENLAELYNKFPNRFVVIQGLTVVYDAESFEQAYAYAVKNFSLGSFIVQECTKDESGFTQTFYSRAIFA